MCLEGGCKSSEVFFGEAERERLAGRQPLCRETYTEAKHSYDNQIKPIELLLFSHVWSPCALCWHTSYHLPARQTTTAQVSVRKKLAVSSKSIMWDDRATCFTGICTSLLITLSLWLHRLYCNPKLYSRVVKVLESISTAALIDISYINHSLNNNWQMLERALLLTNPQKVIRKSSLDSTVPLSSTIVVWIIVLVFYTTTPLPLNLISRLKSHKSFLGESGEWNRAQRRVNVCLTIIRWMKHSKYLHILFFVCLMFKQDNCEFLTLTTTIASSCNSTKSICYTNNISKGSVIQVSHEATTVLTAFNHQEHNHIIIYKAVVFSRH